MQFGRRHVSILCRLKGEKLAVAERAQGPEETTFKYVCLDRQVLPCTVANRCNVRQKDSILTVTLIDFPQ